MHPVTAIINRVEQVLQEQIPEHKQRVFVERTLALSDESNELPAFIVSMGADQPYGPMTTLDRLGSLLSLKISIIDRGANERDLSAALVELRRRVHVALMAPNSLGFEWVPDVGSLGADEPITDNSGALVVRELPTRWQVAYTCDRANPNV